MHTSAAAPSPAAPSFPPTLVLPWPRGAVWQQRCQTWEPATRKRQETAEKKGPANGTVTLPCRNRGCTHCAPFQAKTMARLCPGHRGAWQEGKKELEGEIKGRRISALLLLRFVALLPAPLQLRLLCTAGHGAAASSWSEMFVGPCGQPGAVGTPQPLGSLWGHGAAPSHPPFSPCSRSVPARQSRTWRSLLPSLGLRGCGELIRKDLEVFSRQFRSSPE